MVSEIRSIKYGDKEINYTIDRTDRKTVGIVVDPDGKVIVKVPINLDQQIIQETIYKKRKWYFRIYPGDIHRNFYSSFKVIQIDYLKNHEIKKTT